MSLILSEIYNDFSSLRKLYAVSASVGSGKTHSAVDYMLSDEHDIQSFIYVAPRKELCDQTEGDIYKRMGELGKDAVRVTVINSDNADNVRRAISYYSYPHFSSLVVLMEYNKEIWVLIDIETGILLLATRKKFKKIKKINQEIIIWKSSNTLSMV